MSHRKPPLPSLIMALYLLIAIFTRKKSDKNILLYDENITSLKMKKKNIHFHPVNLFELPLLHF